MSTAPMCRRCWPRFPRPTPWSYAVKRRSRRRGARCRATVKVVARAGVGVDNIDLDAATRAGVRGAQRARRECDLGRRTHRGRAARPHPADSTRQRVHPCRVAGSARRSSRSTCAAALSAWSDWAASDRSSPAAQGIRDARDRPRPVRAPASDLPSWAWSQCPLDTLFATRRCRVVPRSVDP